MRRKFIGYYRVSTRKQGKSGLGLDVQRNIVKSFATMFGGEVIAHFTEVSSGTGVTRDQRPELWAAVDFAEETGAVILVSSVDRVTRNTKLMPLIWDRGVKVEAVDLVFPDPSKEQMVKGIYRQLKATNAPEYRELLKRSTAEEMDAVLLDVEDDYDHDQAVQDHMELMAMMASGMAWNEPDDQAGEGVEQGPGGSGH